MTELFQILRKATDAVFDNLSVEAPLSSDPFISSFGIKTIPESEIPPSLEVDLYGTKSYPAIHTGDTWVYEFSDRLPVTGKMKFKKLALGVKVTEDDYNRLSQTVLRSLVEKELKMNQDYLRTNIINWASVQNDKDAGVVSPLAPSAAGTLSNPTDMGDGDGTTDDTSYIGLLWSGASQTVNNVASFTLTLNKKIKSLIDTTTKRYAVPKTFTLYVPPIFKAILDNGRDMLDATNKALSPNTYSQDLAARGIKVVETPYIDAAYVGLSTDPCNCCIVGDTKENMTLWLGIPSDGAGWDDWTWIDNGVVKFAAKRKKAMFGFEQRPYLINDIFYSCKIPFTTIPYNA